MNDALIDRANPPPRDSRRASCQNRFERYSPTSCRLVDGIISGLTVASGRFGTHMDIELVADGPVTIVVDTTAP